MNRDGVVGEMRTAMSSKASVSTSLRALLDMTVTMIDSGDSDSLAGLGVVSGAGAEADQESTDGGDLPVRIHQARPQAHDMRLDNVFDDLLRYAQYDPSAMRDRVCRAYQGTCIQVQDRSSSRTHLMSCCVTA